MPPTGPPPYLWGVKPENQQFPRKRKAPLLEEMLVTFPDPKNLTRTGNKYEEIVECMRERHREQRQRLLDRHMKEFNEWKEDTNKSVDFDTSFKFYFPLAHPGVIMLPESVALISRPEANAALQRLPASRRNVIVSMDQLKMPPNLSEKDEYRYNELSHPEIAAEIAKQGVAMRNRMRREEQEMRVYQNEALSIFLQALERNYPDKYGKNGSNALAHKVTPTNHAQGPSFGSFVPRGDAINRGPEPRRPSAPISIPKVLNMTSASNASKPAISTPVDRDTDMCDAIQSPQATAGQILTAPASAQPGVSRDPRKPPPSFNPYAMREEIPSSLPPNLNKAREEQLLQYSRHEEHLPQLPLTGPSNIYARREPREDPYSRRENIQPQKAVAYSTMFKSPISPSLHEPNQSPASPSGEHIGGHRMSRQGSDRSAKQSPVVGRDGGAGTTSGWGVSPRNLDTMDPGEIAYNRRKSMPGSMGGL